LLAVRVAVSVAVLVLAASGFAAASPSAPSHRISQRAIGDAPLGLTRRGYERALGRPSITTRFGHSLTRLVYADRELAVYLSRTGRGVAVLTSAKEYRTAAGVGPCSTVASLKRVYGRQLLTQRRAGQVVAYRLGRLVFAARGARVGTVMLAGRGFPATIAVNAGQCGAGEEG
jgi:hypothetical protein